MATNTTSALAQQQLLYLWYVYCFKFFALFLHSILFRILISKLNHIFFLNFSLQTYWQSSHMLPVCPETEITKPLHDQNEPCATLEWNVNQKLLHINRLLKIK